MGQRTPVPWRTIWAAIVSVAIVWLAYQLVVSIGRVLTWAVVALFFAVVLTPAVDLLHHRLRFRRGLATFVVFLSGALLIAGMLYAFIRPLVDSAAGFADDLPGYVEEARRGEGAIGDLIERYEIEQWVEENQDRIRDALTGLGQPAVDVLQTVFSTVFALVTVLVLSFLMIMQGPHVSKTAFAMVPEPHRDRVRTVSVDAARAVSGYVFGNLLISVIAGVSAWLVLFLLGVPYAEVLGLFVAFADLIPLVGATLGAVPCIAFSLLHSVPAGIGAAIFFILYQQFENHVLQVTVMARTVKINPLTVLLSVLVGVELYGVLGALLAIPAAGVVQVVARDIYDERRGRLKPEPTVGADEIPVSVVLQEPPGGE